MKCKKAKKILAVLLLMVLIAGLGICIYFTACGYQMYRAALEDTSLEAAVNNIRSRPDFTDLEDMPKIYLDAVVAVEDKRFFEHNGVDLSAIGRATLHNIQAMDFVEGGSTITQQLAKNLFFTEDKIIQRKVAEVFMAFALEKEYTKDEILELYLNSIYFGDGFYGVAAASQGYFGKPPCEMNANESTLLAGVPNAPSAYAPSTNPELARQRQAQVVALMVKQGLLTEEQAKEILQPVG